MKMYSAYVPLSSNKIGTLKNSQRSSACAVTRKGKTGTFSLWKICTLQIERRQRNHVAICCQFQQIEHFMKYLWLKSKQSVFANKCVFVDERQFIIFFSLFFPHKKCIAIILIVSFKKQILSKSPDCRRDKKWKILPRTTCQKENSGIKKPEDRQNCRRSESSYIFYKDEETWQLYTIFFSRREEEKNNRKVQ